MMFHNKNKMKMRIRKKFKLNWNKIWIKKKRFLKNMYSNSWNGFYNFLKIFSFMKIIICLQYMRNY